MTTDKTLQAPLTALASEVCDFWQEHLAACANDPAARTELMRLMEPSRQMFAEWAKKAQNGTHGAGSFPNGFSPAAPAPAGDAVNVAPSDATRTEAARPTSDDHALRLAQLAYRVAELEKRLAKLESKPRGAAARTQRASGEE